MGASGRPSVAPQPQPGGLLLEFFTQLEPTRCDPNGQEPPSLAPASLPLAPPPSRTVLASGFGPASEVAASGFGPASGGAGWQTPLAVLQIWPLGQPTCWQAALAGPEQTGLPFAS